MRPSSLGRLRSVIGGGLQVSRLATRGFSSHSIDAEGPTKPRHLLSIADLTPGEFKSLVRRAADLKRAVKEQHGVPHPEIAAALRGQTVAMIFSKRSTRTRVSTEAAVTMMGGHPMFLGRDDIQLGVNESLKDTARVISSMTSGIVARVGRHEEVVELAKESSKPIINALSDLYHPLQAVADWLTILETFDPKSTGFFSDESRPPERPLKIAWIGDSNNVLFDLAIASVKMGARIAVATPKDYAIPSSMREQILAAKSDGPQAGGLEETNTPAEALAGANVVVTDTWVSMGQEAETEKRLRDFDGFRITRKLIEDSRADQSWKFMHCLPRHAEEVDDDVFYDPRSLVFQEAENRLWAALAVFDTFLTKRHSM